MALNLTWAVINSILNLAVFLTYSLGLHNDVSCTICLIMLSFILVVYFVTENFIWQKYLLYIFTTWFGVQVGLGGMLWRAWSDSNQSLSRNNLIVMAMFFMSVVFTIGKFIMFTLYHTCCKQQVDKRESHKLLQMKQNKLYGKTNKINVNEN